MWICSCGRTGPIHPGMESLPLHCACGISYTTPPIDQTVEPIPPSIARRGMNVTRAWVAWRKAGFPRRTQQEVDAIRPLCKACDLYDAKKEICTHKDCGCNVARGNFWGDKVSWATEHCPIEKW